MTMQQAYELAKKAFGPRAVVSEERALGVEDGAIIVQRFVGVRGHDSHSWSVKGVGGTWEEAIRDALSRAPLHPKSRHQ